MTQLYQQYHPLVLASASPRRVELLSQLGVDFDQIPADIDEAVLHDEKAHDYVQRVAREKACVIAGSHSDKYILGSDTSIHIDGQILGKPSDKAHFTEMMNLLSGQSHEVITAICVATLINTKMKITESVVTSTVTFATVSTQQIDAYWKTGEPLGKAGGYAIQGMGGQFVTHIDGSYSGIVGLPLAQTVLCLQDAGVISS